MYYEIGLLVDLHCLRLWRTCNQKNPWSLDRRHRISPSLPALRCRLWPIDVKSAAPLAGLGVERRGTRRVRICRSHVLAARALNRFMQARRSPLEVPKAKWRRSPGSPLGGPTGEGDGFSREFFFPKQFTVGVLS